MAFPPRITLALLLGALSLAGLLAATASAGPAAQRSAADRFAPTSPAIAQAEQIARSYWGTDPCDGQVTVSWRKQARDINALSTWSSPTEDAYADPAANRDCAIDLNPAAAFDWPKLCTVIVHEFGHLAGHDHDAQPGRLMSELYTTPLAQCAATARRAVASRAPVTAPPAG